MSKEITLRLMVYAGIGLVIAEAAFAAFMAIPRMALHLEVVELGTVHAHWIFVVVKLILAVILLGFVIPNRNKLGRIKVLLIISGTIVIVLSVPLLENADYYSGQFGFYDVANLLFIRIVVNLIAGILLIIASVKIKRS